MSGELELVAREGLENTSARLLASQEKDRSHLARELHDDICQRLAMLCLRIEKATHSWQRGLISVGDQLEQIRQQCSDLTAHVQALSHELHPAILDNLGLVTAVKQLCREFSEESGAKVEFSEKNVPNCLSRDVALSLFRVIQEALHNAAKHSGETHFVVHLQGRGGEIELEVSDQGIGFDVANLKNHQGLGLVSMTERINLLNGIIHIESKLGVGTRVLVVVPARGPSNGLEIH